MTTPTYCINCGHELGVGRFCINCGQPVPGRHPQAAPDSGAPSPATIPPPVGEVPPSARYPLFADPPPTVVPHAASVAAGPPAAPPTVHTPAPPPAVPPVGSGAPTPRSGTPLAVWLAVGVVLLLLVGAGGFLLLRGGGADDAAADATSSSPATDSTGSDDHTAGSETPAAPDEPDATGTDGPVQPPDPADVVDLTADVEAAVPGQAPGSQDTQGRPVSFEPANMWDGRPRTAWRMPGDGSGETLTFDLGGQAVITEVAMINGYAKIDGPANWYNRNRRITAVQWEFDDGTRVTQELDRSRELQSIEVGPVRTRIIRMHLISVSKPGRNDGRDFTAISELRFSGARD